MPDLMRAKAEEHKVDMDFVLSEAYFAFYWLSEQRQSSMGMGGSHLFFIPLSEIVLYHEVFCPKMDKEHFVRVIRSADRAYCSHHISKMKNRAEKKRLTKSK